MNWGVDCGNVEFNRRIAVWCGRRRWRHTSSASRTSSIEVPAAIRPAAVNGQECKVNSNLLGYYTSTPPAPRDVRGYTNLGFTAQQLPNDIRGNHQTSMRVLQTVSNRISLHTKIKKSVQTRHSIRIISPANVRFQLGSRKSWTRSEVHIYFNVSTLRLPNTSPPNSG